MAKKERIRDIKQGRVKPSSVRKKEKKIAFAPNSLKAKAFLTDVFMLFMPLIYFVIYVIMHGLESASHEKLLTWSYALVPYLLILTFFMFKDEGRTPGARSQGLKVIDLETGVKPSLAVLLFRNLSSILTYIIVFSWFIPLFRKDKRTLHAWLSKTAIIVDENPPQERVYKTKS